MKTTNRYININNTVIRIPDNPEEFFNTLNMKDGDELYNLDIFKSWTFEEQMTYYYECLNLPKNKRKSPWQIVMEGFCNDILGGGEIDTFYRLSDYKNPVAVIADERKKNGKIDPETIHTIVEYAPYGIGEIEIRNLCEYYDIATKNYDIFPRLVMIGTELTDSGKRALQMYQRDVTIIIIK